MKDLVIKKALEAWDGFLPDYWKRLWERIIPCIVNAESDEQALEWIEYHINQVQQIQYDDINRREKM